MTVAGFEDGGVIPRRHSCEGEDISPAIEWSGPPAGAKSFALIVDDPDAPVGTWNHWLLWDIPAGAGRLSEHFRPGDVGLSGNNDFGKPGYGGPCPPKGHGPHRYFFRLFALDTETLCLEAGARRAALERAMDSHIIAGARYMGRYERK